MNIIVIKIGIETFIGDILEETDTEYTLKNFCSIIPNADGSNGIHVYPSSNFYADNIATFNKSLISFSGKPQEEIAMNYKEAFSGIIVPSSQLIVN